MHCLSFLHFVGMREGRFFFSCSISCVAHFHRCIDIHKGKVKQIVGSTLKNLGSDCGATVLVTNFETDESPAEFAELYKKDGLTGGHVIMLGANVASQFAAIEALHAYPGNLMHFHNHLVFPFLMHIYSGKRRNVHPALPPAYPGGMQIGGGINANNAKAYLMEGASHVIVTSYVFNDGKMDLERLKHLVNLIGKDNLVLDLSCRKKAWN